MKYGSLMASLILACLVPSAYASNAQQITTSQTTSTYAKTKYPIVLVHGMAGFIRSDNASGQDYWYQIAPDLARNGANTWVTRVSPFNSTEVRGEQLVQQVEDILAITGQTKINLIGHSHGGPTARYVAGVMPNNVASVTAVGSPNKGSPLSDVILRAEGTPAEGPLVNMVNFISNMIVWSKGFDPKEFPHDALAGSKSLSTEGSALFNNQFPMGVPTTTCGEGAYQEKGIYFYSFTGSAVLSNLADLTDAFLLSTSRNIPETNDGLVSRCSAKFGKTIRDDYRWNHLDEVNQVLGLRAIFAPDPVQVYREQANRLKLQGL